MSLATLRRFAALGLLILASVVASVGCKPSQGSAPGPADSAAAAAKPYPKTVEEAEALKKTGVSWTNQEIRAYYNKVVAGIAPSNDAWKKQGLSVEERARRAFEIRHVVRLTARAMMASAAEVELLRKRDQEKYGNPDGPTFEQLVESGKKKGKEGEALYEGIVESAQRTDEGINAMHRSP